MRKNKKPNFQADYEAYRDTVLEGECPVDYDVAQEVNHNVDTNVDDAASKTKSGGQNEKEGQKRAVVTYKYSNKGRGDLHEAVVVAGKPVFIKYDDMSGQIKVVEEIEEGHRVIKAPYPEEYPYQPYEFSNIEEVQDVVKKVKETSLGSLYLKAKGYVQDYNDQDQNKLILIASDIIFSHFQDKFATTHYDCIVGDNDSGKSSLGITFEAMGYRPVYMTDPSAANIFRCLGSIEPGQCAIILDEADKIDKSPEMMAILKTGYQLNGKVPKINTNTLRQEFFHTYGLKIIISEKSMSLTEAKGVHDRTFSSTAYSGDSKFDIKETLNPQGNSECQTRLNEILAFRKLILVYRLVHFKDPIPDTDTGLKRRNRELCKPILDLFRGSSPEIQVEIKSMLEYFLATKKQRRENTIEAALFPIMTNLVSLHGKEVAASQIWGEIISGTQIEGHHDEKRPNEYQTADYGTIYRNTITNIICDKFGAQRKHKEKGNVLIFDLDKLVKIGKSYDLETKIQLKLPDNPRSDSEGSEGSEGIRKEAGTTENRDDIESSMPGLEPNISRVTINDDPRYLVTKEYAQPNSPLEPSDPSDPSDLDSTTNDTEAMPDAIFRLGQTDRYQCTDCKLCGDKWEMRKHPLRCKRRKQANLTKAVAPDTLNMRLESKTTALT